jgi:hypothetical protein
MYATTVSSLKVSAPAAFSLHLYVSWAARIKIALTYSVVQNCIVLHIVKTGVQFNSIWLSIDLLRNV